MSLDKRSIELGTEGWGVKEDNLLAFRKDRTRYVEKPFTFSRASLGSVVNKDGFLQIQETLREELAPLEDYDTNFSANPNAGTVTEENGVLTAVGANSSGTQVQMTSRDITVNNVYKISFTISDYVSGQFKLSVGNNYTPAASGNGDFEFYIVYASGIDRIYYSFELFTGTVSNVSVKEYIPDTARISYLNTPNGHLLLEPQSTNYATNSTQPSIWHSSANVNITADAIQAPTGKNEASLVVTTVDALSYSRGYITLPSGTGTQVVTASVFLKYYNSQWVIIRPAFWNGTGATGDQRTWFDIQNGVIGTNDNENATIEDYGNGWYRCSVTWTVDKDADINGYVTITQAIADNDFSNQIVGNGYYAFGMQLEELSYSTSYIPRYSQTQVTRAAETANNCGAVQDFNDDEGVLFVEMAALDDDLTDRQIAISDSNSQNHIRIYPTTSSNRVTVAVKTATVNQYVYYHDGIDNTTKNFRIAVKYKSNNFSTFINGEEVDSSSSGSAPTGLIKLNLDGGSGSSPFYGKIKELKVYTETLNDAELRLLTKYAPKDYDAAFTADYVDSLAEFTVLRTEATDKLYYSISDGTNSVSGSATITATQVTISNIDISSLSDGTLTLSVYIEDERKQRGVTVTDTTIKDTTNTPLYSYALQQRATGATFEDLDNSESIIESLNVEV